MMSCQSPNNRTSNTSTGWSECYSGYECIKIDSNNMVVRDLDDIGNVRSISVLNVHSGQGVQLIFIGGTIKYMGQSGYHPNKFVDVDSLEGESAKLINL